jgi:uncharacterized protein (AIM24 family)
MLLSMARPNFPERDSVPPPSFEDRGTARRLTARPPSFVDSTRGDIAHEDFLFHLYRGSELLQDNRVLEAKEELERALTLQPSDSKGQDLLAAVYFRIGHYARAISIYEHLEASFPEDTSLKTNLALCYLKIAQPQMAREALFDVLRLNVAHRRAWGYLGIAHEQLGELDQAQAAFERGGHPIMARKMAERRNRFSIPVAAIPDGPVRPEGERAESRTAFEDLDSGELNFELAEPGTSPAREGWETLEIGASPLIDPHLPGPLSISVSKPSSPQHEAVTSPPPAHPNPAAGRTLPIAARPEDAGRAARASMLTFPAEAAVMLHPSGVALAQTRTNPARSFATRAEALRATQGGPSAALMSRKAGDADTASVLGGIASPFVRVDGDSELVIGPRAGRRIIALELHDDVAFAVEDLLVGFELSLAYESGLLALDGADSISVVQLRGSGAVLLELVNGFVTMGVSAARPVSARRDFVVGWLGRLHPSAVPATESPGGQRGIVAFSGDGTVLLANR